MVRQRAARLAPVPTPSVRGGLPEGVTDADLAARARSGDAWAEEALFRRHVDYMAALSFRLLRNRSDSEDALQDTFLDAFAQLRKGAEPESFRKWLAGIVVHKAHRRFRKRKLRALLGLSQDLADAAIRSMASPGTSPELRTELGLLDLALGMLSEADRAAWLLRYVEGYELEEVAGLCRCSLATAKRRIVRARAVVAAHVDVDEPEGEGV